jgi:oligopeptide transport system ATP-binding protein
VITPLLEVDDLSRHYKTRRGLYTRGGSQITRAVDHVSLAINEGETLAVVGESGSGKTTLARAIVGTLRPTAGTITFRGQPIDWTKGRTPPELRRQVQMVFQDPAASLDPRMSVQRAVAEGIRRHKLRPTKDAIDARVLEILDLVGLNERIAGQLPHELSGGQKQRVAIARALSVEPSLMLCDEAVSALDVSVQAQVLNLLLDLQGKLGLAYLFITHDLGVVRHVADRVLVMYHGRVVETADNDELFAHPRHPYTELLLSSVPVPEPDGSMVAASRATGSVAVPDHGCAFMPRCPLAEESCGAAAPELSGNAHPVACFVRAGSSAQGEAPGPAARGVGAGATPSPP